MKKVLYEELLPEECVQRIQEMPVAYLPLGTLEWHGPHMPLGADGIQSKELFVRVAEKVGGVVLPMLFMGPDRVFHDRGTAFYGMDINTEGALNTYCVQQMKGSAYWMEKALFQDNLRSIFAQLFRAGIRIVVGHGHGPSTNVFQELKEEAEEKIQTLDTQVLLLIAMNNMMDDYTGDLVEYSGEYKEDAGKRYQECFKILMRYGWSYEREEADLVYGNHELYKKES